MTAAPTQAVEIPAVRSFPKYLLEGNVLDAARERIRWLYSEFPRVSVSTSGGKDSTVVLELALEAATELDRLPLHVVWLDQECEYQATVAYQRYIRDRPGIDMDWYQIPFRLFNATNHADPWLQVWDAAPDAQWVREKEPGAIHENRLRMRNGHTPDRFKDVLKAINQETGGAILTGMRAEESPGRRILMTSMPSYKWVTWGSPGKKKEPQSFRMFHPIYDWSYKDVWKAIDQHGWRYNEHYNHLFQYGVNNRRMRVSNYHHESALLSLHSLQEIEPETWEAATERLDGISTYGHLTNTQMPKALPHMFASWAEYRDYLIENLATDEDQRTKYRQQVQMLASNLPAHDPEKLARVMVKSVIKNDLYGALVRDYVVVNAQNAVTGRTWKKKRKVSS